MEMMEIEIGPKCNLCAMHTQMRRFFPTKYVSVVCVNVLCKGYAHVVARLLFSEQIQMPEQKVWPDTLLSVTKKEIEKFAESVLRDLVLIVSLKGWRMKWTKAPSGICMKAKTVFISEDYIRKPIWEAKENVLRLIAHIFTDDIQGASFYKVYTNLLKDFML